MVISRFAHDNRPKPLAYSWCRSSVNWYISDDGGIVHSELTYGGGLIMVGGEQSGPNRRFGVDMQSPLSARCNTQCLMVYVDDVDAHCERARATGAAIVQEPAVHDYGEAYWADRSYGATDPEGHLWWFTQRLRDPPV